MPTTYYPQSTTQLPQTTNRGGNLGSPLNHYISNSAPYHQQRTQQQQYQLSAQWQQQQNQQNLSPFSANTPTFNRLFERPTLADDETPEHMTVEYVLNQIPWLNADKLRSTLKKLPQLTAHAAAQDQAPDPFLVDATEKRRDSMVRRSSNKPRHYISEDGLGYICDTEEQDPSVLLRGIITNKQKKNYREGFSLSDGRNNARHLKEYDDLRFLWINGQIVADLSKKRDILDGYTCQIQYAGVFITIGWNICPSVLLAAVRNKKDLSGVCAANFMKNRRTLCMDRMRHPPIQSQPQPPTQQHTSDPMNQAPPTQVERPTSQQPPAQTVSPVSTPPLPSQQVTLPTSTNNGNTAQTSLSTNASADQQLLQPRQATNGNAQPTTIVYQTINKYNFGNGAIRDATVILDQSGKVTQQMRDRETEVQYESTSSSSTTSSRSDSISPLLSAQLSAPQGSTIVFNDTTFQAQSVGRDATVCNGDTTIVHQV